MKDAGITAPVPRGDWQANVNYYFLNIVNHNGISWIAKRENMGQEPSDGLYWQRFGTSVPIATTSVAGIVKPDGTTISVGLDGTIEVKIDGESIFIDDEDDKIKANLATLADVDITDLEDGYVLAWDATAEKFVAVEKGGGGILPHLIIITEPNETSVKAVKGQTEIVAVETSSGHYECDLPEFGTWTIHAILNGDDAQVSLVVDTVKVYTVDDSHFHADITVTYPTGAQVSCSKSGETTLYATGSPYTFTVHSAGTWTITSTYNGVTITENVVITTSGQTESVNMVYKTITVDIYSAASDTVSFTDATGAKTATTNSSGVASGVSIALNRYDGNITFTSSVAKDPDNLSNDYSKTITVTDATTDIYVMPDGEVIYWYGYIGNELVRDGTNLTVTNYTNSIYAGLTGPQSGASIDKLLTTNAIDITDKSYLKIIVNSASISNYAQYSRLYYYVGEAGGNIVTDTAITTPTLVSEDLQRYTAGNKYVGAQFQAYTRGGVQITFNAMWLE